MSQLKIVNLNSDNGKLVSEVVVPEKFILIWGYVGNNVICLYSKLHLNILIMEMYIPPVWFIGCFHL